MAMGAWAWVLLEGKQPGDTLVSAAQKKKEKEKKGKNLFFAHVDAMACRPLRQGRRGRGRMREDEWNAGEWQCGFQVQI
jgi:hypothetical protein